MSLVRLRIWVANLSIQKKMIERNTTQKIPSDQYKDSFKVPDNQNPSEEKYIFFTSTPSKIRQKCEDFSNILATDRLH